MQRWKSIAILGIILLSLVPVYLLHRYLQKQMRPRESGRRFLWWLLTMLALVFVYPFLLVLLIRMLFPSA